MISYADVIVDLQAGDTGKGKVAHALAKEPKRYTHVVRYNGGGNAGHTVYHNDNKFVTHLVPVGVFYGIKSIIGLGCVINIEKLVKEINELQENGVNVKDYLFIDERAHIITDSHIEEDSKILFEGAQGFELDIDWGDYPYVTSSHCTVGSAVLNGVTPQSIKNVYGIAKAYRTYVGAKQFEGDDPIFETIRELGQEYGATTGRKRQVDWLDVNDLIRACNINGVTELIINKLDILEDAGSLKFYYNGELRNAHDIKYFQELVEMYILNECPSVMGVKFSVTPYAI